MNTCESKVEWNLLMGILKQEWAELTYDDLQGIEGRQDELLDRIQKRTGKSRDAIEAAIMQYRSSLATGNHHRRMIIPTHFRD